VELPLLSILVIIGPERSRCIPLLKALAEQTISSQCEVILVDIATDDTPALIPPPGLEIHIIKQPGSYDWGGARAMAVRLAKAPIVAFLEDHTLPDLHWAEEIKYEFDRSSSAISAVCYAFTNGSPDTYFFRSVFMAEYGTLAHPLPAGEPPSATANNIAYRRNALLALGEKLDDLLELDFFCQKYMAADFKAVSAPRALVAHQTNTHLRDLIAGHFNYARLFSNRRLRHEKWNTPKRILGVFSIPVLVPLLRLKRLFMALRGRSLTCDAVSGLPIILLLYFVGSLGEALGLLEGGEFTAKEVVWLEIIAPRASR
jgi:GT2 family glycosyltransferase